MTFTITKLRLGIAILALALAVPATAFATHRFPDVTHGPPFEAAINWAADKGITTGFGDGTFGPDLPVTRAQNVTFAHRYDTNVVQPALAAQTIGLLGSDSSFDELSAEGDVGLSASVTIPAGHTGIIVATFAAESSCTGGSGVTSFWCSVILRMDGTAMHGDAGSSDTSATNYAFDSSDAASEGTKSWEGHSMTRVSDDLAAGTYTFTVEIDNIPGFLGTAPTLGLDDMVLTAVVYLTS